jgi:hypothetical protein
VRSSPERAHAGSVEAAPLAGTRGPGPSSHTPRGRVPCSERSSHTAWLVAPSWSLADTAGMQPPALVECRVFTPTQEPP